MQDTGSNPFPGLVTVDWSFLDDSSTRTKCPKCNKSRKYYCYSCCIALPHIQDKLPKVKLPLKVDIIKHPGELDGKSTAPHATILAPEDVTIHTFPCIPDYDRNKVIIVFPGETSVTLDDLKAAESGSDSIKVTAENHQPLSHPKDNINEDLEHKSDFNPKADSLKRRSEDRELDNDILKEPSSTECKVSCNTGSQPRSDDAAQSLETNLQNLKRKRDLAVEDKNGGTETAGLGCSKDSAAAVKHQKTHLLQCPYERVVFIDCTWNQTKQIVNDERLHGLKRVELKSQLTHFWRTQEGMPKTYLSTIEAIYFFFKDFHSIFVDPIYRHVIIVFPGETSVTLDDLKAAESGSDSIKVTAENHQPLSHPKDNINEDLEHKSDFNPKADSLKRRSEDRELDNDILKEPSSTECKVSCNTGSQPRSDDAAQSLETNLQNLKRKRDLAVEDKNGGTETAGLGCSKDSAAAVKHQKTHLLQCPYERVVFIDCTWNQTKQIVNDERLHGLKRVELKSQLTHFWRTQEGMPKTYLSTIEAIYFFFKDFHSIFVDPIYRHEYDNLLMFFCFMYHKIKR